MNKNIMVTTTEPHSMFGSNSNLDTIKSISKKLCENNVPINKNKYFSCYFHGELEDIMGFDIVNHIGGELPIIKYGDMIAIKSVTMKGKIIDSMMVVGGYIDVDRLYALIFTEDEAKEFIKKERKLEFGMIKFDWKNHE
ncbi:hypothetical protein CL614_09635 [archaeon]|nr:hypothetical protein [archaeon]|tara:strand:+ start:561 stop:977 length:417 start_codon:yes stop_codon:yes gene_type:complete